jgi:hypothetical protein
MLLPPEKARRLGTGNYTRVSSEALRSVDYVPGSGTLELEFIDGAVYHYYKVPARYWERIGEIIASGESLGTYINQDFKAAVNELELDYRRIT